MAGGDADRQLLCHGEGLRNGAHIACAYRRCWARGVPNEWSEFGHDRALFRLACGELGYG